MRKLIAAVFDDLDATENGTETVAQTTVSVGWNGEWFELDLTEANAAAAEKTIRRYTRAGHRLGSPPKRRRAPHSASLADARRDGKAMRAFADASKGRYSYKAYPRGAGYSTTYTYPDDLRRAWAAHLAEGATGGQ